ncbi:MAG TPA: AAA-like domain-containing protein, partial [Verrucomicrobiota bacterium]|nr:AAA-like domain-containing protein [Verrucomicrobiota bacterium]
NLERNLQWRVLPGIAGSLFLLWDAVETLPPCVREEFHSLLISWHNQPALEPDSPMARIACVLTGTCDRFWARREIRLLDDDGGFKIGTIIRPAGFRREEIEELNRRVGIVLRGAEELDHFHHLVGGQPFLVRSGLEYLRSRGGGIAELEAIADRSDAPWSEFLEWLAQECDAVPRIKQVVVDLTVNRQPFDDSARWAARGLGLLADDRDTARLRCELYRRYFARRYGSA